MHFVYMSPFPCKEYGPAPYILYQLQLIECIIICSHIDGGAVIIMGQDQTLIRGLGQRLSHAISNFVYCTQSLTDFIVHLVYVKVKGQAFIQPKA